MKTPVKIISALLAAALTAASFPVGTSAMVQPKSESPYKIKSAYDFEGFDAKVTVLEHRKTGATVELILNDDPNRYFMLGFETPSSDNKGTAHVFEHSALNGSVKYPSRSLSAALRSRSYTSFLNAYTKEACTLFPVASLSEKQLLALADYYTDLCFEPMILEDEDIFRSEAWRLTLDDPDGDITINGTIYTEMRDKYSADTAAARAAMGLLYGGCASSYEPGGIPGEILTLTYDDVKAFHEKYYRPSNCTAYLYGDIKDPDAFLDLLDDYFERFDDGSQKEEAATDGYTETFSSGYVEMKYDFPSPDAGGMADSHMVFAIDLGSVDDDTLGSLYAFAKYCDLEYSTPQLVLRSMFPQTDYSFTILPDAGNAVMCVRADNIDETAAPLFRTTVLALMSEIAENGLAVEELDYFRTRMEYDAALAHEGQNAVINLLMSMANYNSGKRGELFYVKMRDRMNDMSWFDNNLIRSLASSYFANPERSAMAVVTPNAELYGENEKKLADSLEKISASMSEEDRKTLTEDTKRIAAKASDDPTEYLNKLNVVSVSDLPDDVKHADAVDETDENGTRHITVYTDTDGIDATRLYLDASAVPQDMLGYLALYVDLVNGCFIQAAGNVRDDLPYLISSSTAGGMEISLIASKAGDDFLPYVTAEFACRPEKLGDAFDLAYDRLFASSFDDPGKVAEGISLIRRTVMNNIMNNPELIACHSAGCAKGLDYFEYTHYLEYYDFLTALEEDGDTGPDSICEKLDSIRDYLCNSNGAVIGCAIAESEKAAYNKTADAFVGKLENSERQPCEYDLIEHEYPLGIITSGQVVSNAVTTSASDLDIEANSPASSVALSIITDKYLRGETRDRYGAYVCSYMDRYPAFSLFTGKDPTTGAAFEAIGKAADAWKEIRAHLTQEELDGYIITLHSSESQSNGKISDAMNVVSDMVAGLDSSYRNERLKTLKDLHTGDLSRYDALFEKLSKEGNRVSAGSADMIKKDAGNYAQVINQFAK